MQARRANITITYQGTDITENIAPDLLSFKYEDYACDSSDNIDIELKDPKSKWLNNWFPEKGDFIVATLNTFNWTKEGDNKSLDCGIFVVDEPEYSGPPSKLTIKALGMPSNTNFTTTKKSRAWENISLSGIASNIANNADLELFFDSSTNPVYARKDQSETSDMSFLNELCKNEGMGFKTTDKKIIIFSQADYEKKASIATISRKSKELNSYSLKSSLTNTGYAACKVQYRNAKKGQVFSYIFSTQDDLNDSDKIYQVNTICTSLGEAERLARQKLRELNKKENTVTLNLVGNTKWVSGVCVDLTDFGVFNGKYFIDKASHNLPKYDVDLELHKVLEGY